MAIYNQSSTLASLHCQTHYPFKVATITACLLIIARPTIALTMLPPFESH